MCLAGPVAEVAVQLQGPGRAGGGGREVLGHGLREAQQQQSAGLAGPVAGLAGGGERGLLQGQALIPVAPGVQEAGHRGRDQHRVQQASAGGGVPGGRVQVGALGLQPGGRLPWRGHRRRAGGRVAGRRGAFGGEP